MSIKIRYTGDISPIRIMALSAVLDDWKTDEVRDLDESIANKILKDNRNFSRVGSSPAPKVVKPTVKGYTKEQLFDKTEEEQEEILKELGLSGKEINKLDREFQKVNKILELQ